MVLDGTCVEVTQNCPHFRCLGCYNCLKSVPLLLPFCCFTLEPLLCSGPPRVSISEKKLRFHTSPWFWHDLVSFYHGSTPSLLLILLCLLWLTCLHTCRHTPASWPSHWLCQLFLLMYPSGSPLHLFQICSQMTELVKENSPGSST